MATYSPKLQGVEGVATASPAAAMEAERMRGEITSSIFAAADKAYNEYKIDYVKSTAEEVSNLQDEFLDRNQRAEAAKEGLATLDQNKSGGFFALDSSGGNQKVLDEYMTTAARLKRAADNGMSPDEYTERVASLTKKAIRAYPGMADVIRQQIGEASGLPGADRFAARRYVQETFGGGGRDKGGDKMGGKVLEDEIKTIAAHSNVPVTEIYKIVGTPEYTAIRNAAYESRSYELAAKAANDRAAATTGASTQDSLQAAHAMGVGASLTSANEFLKFRTTNAPLFAKLEGAVQSGKLDDINTTLVELDVISTQGTAVIAKNFRAADEQLRQRRALGQISPADYTAAQEILKGQREAALESFDPKYIRTTAKILSAHKDKTLKDQMEIVRASVDFIKLFGSSELISAYYGGDENTRETIRKQSPALGKVLDDHLPILKGMQTTTVNPITPLVYASVGDAVADAKATPEATPERPLPPGASSVEQQAQRKARVESTIIEGQELLRKYQKEPKGLVTRQGANTLATALNNGMQYNAAVEKLEEGSEALTEMFQKIPDEDKLPIKASLAQQAVRAAEIVNQATQQAEAKHNVKLQIGVRSNGSVGVVPPMDLFESISVSRGRSLSGSPAQVLPDLGVFAKYGELRYKVIKTGKEEEVARYAKAATEWEASQRRRANTMVLAEVVATGANKKTVGDKIAATLNQKAPMQPFFSDLPVAAQPTGAPKQTPSSPAPVGTLNKESQLKGAVTSGLEDLKRELEKEKVALEDIKPGTRLHTMTQENIKAIEAEIKRNTK